MSKIDEKLGEVIDTLTKLAETNGGQAVDLAVQVALVDGLTSIITKFAALTISGALLRFLVWPWFKHARAKWNDRGSYDDTNLGHGIGLSVIGSMTSLAFFVSAIGLVKPWAWIALTEPKLYLAKQIMKAAGL